MSSFLRFRSDVELWLPWRFQPSRQAALDFVVNAYTEMGLKPKLLDVPGDPFNISAIRNEAVRLSKKPFIIISDADTIAEPASLIYALDIVNAKDLTTLPYVDYKSLGLTGTLEAFGGTELSMCSNYRIPQACSGVFVTTKTAWAKHYGHDEKFAGWGCEDAAWEITQKTLCGQVPRVQGSVYALTHDSQDKDGEATKKNYGRIYEYQLADGDPEAILKLVK